MQGTHTWKTSRAFLTILAVAALMLALLAQASLSRSAFAQTEGFVCVEVNLDQLLAGTVTVNDTPLTVDATLLAQLIAGTGALIEADLIDALEAGELVDLVVDGAVITDINPAENCAAQGEVIVCVQLALEDLLTGEITVNGDLLTVDATLLAQLVAGMGGLLEEGLIDALEAGEPVNLVVADGVIVDINLGEDCPVDGEKPTDNQQGEKPADNQQGGTGDAEVIVCVQLTLADLLTGAITIDGVLDLTVDAELLLQLTAGTGALLEDGLVADLTTGTRVNLVIEDGVIVDINPGKGCVDNDQKGEEPAKTPDNQQEEPAKTPDNQQEEPAKTPDNQQEEPAKTPDNQQEEPAKTPDNQQEEPAKTPDNQQEEPAKTPDNQQEEPAKTPDNQQEEPAKTPDNQQEEPAKTPDNQQEEPAKTPDNQQEEPAKTPDNQQEEPAKTPDNQQEEPAKTPDNQQEEPAKTPDNQQEEPVETPDNQQEEVDVPSQMPSTGAGGAIPAAGAGIAYLAGIAAMAGALLTRRQR